MKTVSYERLKLQHGNKAGFTKIASGSSDKLFQEVTKPDGFGAFSTVIGETPNLELWVFNGHIDWFHYYETGCFRPIWADQTRSPVRSASAESYYNK